MELDISECLEIIGGLGFSVFRIVIWGIVCGIIALSVSLTLILIFRKTILKKRAHLILRILSISYFVIIPMLAGFFAFKWGVTDGAGTELKKASAKYTAGLNKKLSDALTDATKDLVNKKSGLIEMSANDLVDSLSVKIFERYSAVLGERTTEQGMKAKVTGILFKIVKTKGFSWAMKKGIRKIIEKTFHSDKNLTKEAMDKKLGEAFNKNIFSAILEMQVDHFFGRMKRSVIILFLIILLVPAAEISIAFWYFNKKKREGVANLN